MKNLTKSICAALALTFAAGSAVPVGAAPLVAPTAQSGSVSDNGVINVQSREDIRRERRMERRENRMERRQDRRDARAERRQDRRDARFERRGSYYYYNGRRGYRYQRPGYRQYNGWWFPASAFVIGAIIASQAERPSYGSAHVRWCYDRYRSYRASDNSFQPYNGPRQQCYSPYS